MSVTAQSIVACEVTLYGQVQGVGLRPTIARLASELRLSGSVANSASGVVVRLEGLPESIEEFHNRLFDELPASAHVTVTDKRSCEPLGISGFQIVSSTLDGSLTARVPVDLATCKACFAETSTDEDRRAGYEFTSCTNCGPRYSIIEAMPFDRCRTSMSRFEMCAHCDREYISEFNRRFHSQTNACPTCGPTCVCGDDSFTTESAARAILDGQILAMKGLGGYQLIVDATNSAAIARLRNRKCRPARPLAVMVKSLSDAEVLVELTDRERSVLCGPERPIVLARARTPGGTLCHTEIHPRLNQMGVFLPTTPLHWLLLQHCERPLVVTSGNADGDPLATARADAERDLAGIADVWLHHDRDIVRPVDDSVVRVIANRPVTIRNARGLAPLSLAAIDRFAQECASDGSVLPPVLAVGGHQKNSLALFNGHQAVLGPHIGDLDSLATRKRFVDHVESFQTLYRCEPQFVAHDCHPDYFSTQWAESSITARLPVQHHHAHVVSAMVEHDWLDREVLGVAFDGTGDGTDGTVWGGEFLRSTVHGFERVGHLRSFHLLGGETAIREPWRVAVALLLDAVGQDAVDTFATTWARTADVRAIEKLARNGLAVETTSAGRLFDGVASLILGIADSDFDGQPAMLLESAADPSVTDSYEFFTNRLDDGCSAFPSIHTEPDRDTKSTAMWQLDWRPVVRQIVSDINHGCAESFMAAKFHRGLARGVASACQRFQLPVTLAGGVFQNGLLTEWVLDELASSDFEVACHSTVPPNDGGLAAGQLGIALARLNQQQREI
jgi:hydrogenase maturation protein HypF